jgi:hypothetical protein
MVMMSKKGSADAGAVFLPEWFIPSDRDVACGWARQNHSHGKHCYIKNKHSQRSIRSHTAFSLPTVGNQRFRKLVEHSAPLYLSAQTKLDKTQVIASVVDKVRRESPGGGFVKRDFHTGLWFEIGDDKARDKTGHAIRRALNETKKRKYLSKYPKNKKKGAGSEEKSADEPSTSSPRTKLPLMTLDDDNFEDEDKLAGRKSLLGFHTDAKFASSLYSPLPFHENDSLVVPSFLYQQSALSNMQQDHSFRPSSQARAMDLGLGFQSTTSSIAQNNQPLFDILGGHHASEEGFHTHGAQHQYSTEAQEKLLNKRMGGFFSLSNRQGLLDDFGAPSNLPHGNNSTFVSSTNPNPDILLSGCNDTYNLQDFVGGGCSDTLLGLSSCGGNTQPVDSNNHFNFDCFPQGRIFPGSGRGEDNHVDDRRGTWN